MPSSNWLTEIQHTQSIKRDIIFDKGNKSQSQIYSNIFATHNLIRCRCKHFDGGGKDLHTSQTQLSKSVNSSNQKKLFLCGSLLNSNVYNKYIGEQEVKLKWISYHWRASLPPEDSELEVVEVPDIRYVWGFVSLRHWNVDVNAVPTSSQWEFWWTYFGFSWEENILLNCRQVSKRMSDLLLCMSTTCSWFTLLLPHIQCFTMSFWEWKQNDNQYFDQFAQFFLTCFHIYTRTRTRAMMIKIIHSFIITRWRCVFF